MSKNLPILAIVGGVLALLGALVLVDIANILLALFAFVAAGFLIARRDPEGMATGAGGAVLGIVGLLGLLENLSTQEGGGLDFGIPAGVGQALLIIAVLAPAVAVLWLHWDELGVGWAGPAAGALALAAIFALVWNGRLTDQTDFAGYLVGLLALAGSVLPAVQRLREE